MVSDLKKTSVALRTVVYMDDGPAPAGTLDYEGLITGSAPMPDQAPERRRSGRYLLPGGTTGEPKGVAISHASLLTSAIGSQATFPIMVPGGRLLHTAPMFHLAGLAAWVMQSVVGGTHVILPGFDPAEVLRAIEVHAVTSSLLVPTMIQMVVDHPDASDAAGD